jgi:hypothetical protein
MRISLAWLENGARRIAGIIASLLPRHTWDALEPHIPVTSSAFACSLLTVLAGAAIGIPGFFEHAQGQSGMYVDMLMNAADQGKAPTRAMAVGMNAFSLFTFLLLTPQGLVSLYLTSTGFVRTAGAWFDDPRGDPILSTIDWSARTLVGKTRDKHTRRTRESLEGPEVRDIVVSGARAMIPEADLVIIASRRKPGWEKDTVVVTESATYRIGTIVERTIEGRLRTLYPLVEHRDLEVFRRTVHYDIGPRHDRGFTN